MDKPVYIIVVTGGFYSGSSTFMHTISPDSLSTNIIHDDEILALCYVEDSFRFNSNWDRISDADVLGFIVALDSTRPDLFREARAIAQLYEKYAPTPYIYAATSQEHPDAWDVDAIRIALRIPSHIPIVPCNAHDRESVKRVLITLLETVLNTLENED